jgi:hypothetical protein
VKGLGLRALEAESASSHPEDGAPGDIDRPLAALTSPTPDAASPGAAIRSWVAQGGGVPSAQIMTSDNQASPLDEAENPAVQQVLDAMESAAINPEDALQISLVLLNFVEEYHLDNLEELLGDEQPDAISIAVWAADSARLKAARELLEEVLGENEEDDLDGEEDDDADDEESEEA